MLVDNKAHFQSESLASLHLGHAIDLMRKAYKSSKSKNSIERELGKRCALSSIIHSFCALESEVNYLGVSMFHNPSSQLYVSIDRRDFLLEKFVRSWDTKNTLEKIKVIFQYGGNYVISGEIETKFRELNTLRNWITHGISTVTTLTLEFLGEENDSHGRIQKFNILDEEKGVDWAKKFPNTKFNNPKELTSTDAKKSLSIMLDIFRIITEIEQRPMLITTCETPHNVYALWKESFDNLEFLKLE